MIDKEINWGWAAFWFFALWTYYFVKCATLENEIKKLKKEKLDITQ